MAIICHKYYSTKQFHYWHEDGTFVAEASDLTAGHTSELFGRVYDDACDEGLVLVSHVTGKEVVFVIDHVDHDSEGDIGGWRLVPINASGHRDTTKNYTVLVIND